MVMSKEWLVGFIEGEGNFHVALSKNHKTLSWKYPFEFYPILQFRIFLREDDHAVLEKIKSFLGFGKIYKRNLEYSRKKGINSRDQHVFYVTSIKDLLKLRDILLSTTFHTKKKRDMNTFFRIVEIKRSKGHLLKEGYDEIMGLVRNINGGNRENFKIKPLTE